MRPTTAFDDNVFDITALRAPDGLKAPVTIDEILEALCELDRGPHHPPGGKPNRLCSTSRALAA